MPIAEQITTGYRIDTQKSFGLPGKRRLPVFQCSLMVEKKWSTVSDLLIAGRVFSTVLNNFSLPAANNKKSK